MTDNIKLLLKYEGKKKSHDLFLTFAINLIILIILTVESLNTIPKISTSYQFMNYVTFNIYQIFSILMLTFVMISASSIRDIKKYRYLLSYPIKNKELFVFIKIKKLKKYILTISINLIVVFYIGIKFDQNLKFFIFFLLGFLAITTLCYLISDIICFTLYLIFPSYWFLTLICSLINIPILVIINTMRNSNIPNFYNSNKLYIQTLDKVFPYCKFIKELIFNNFNFTYTILVIVVSIINIILLILLYEILIKSIFYRVLEKEDGRRVNYSKINIDKIKPQNYFIASFIHESKYLFRQNKNFIFNNYVILMFILLFSTQIISRIYLKSSSNELNSLITNDNIIKNDMSLVLIIYLVSLVIDIITYTLNAGRIALGKKYFCFNKYLQLNSKNAIYSFISMRLIISFCYYLLLLILLRIFNLTPRIVIVTFIICTINIITVGILDLIIDIKIPNMYTKMKFNNFMSDLIKGAIIIIFKILHFAAFVLITKYLIHILSVALLINNLIFLLPVIIVINSKHILNTYNRISSY